MGAEKILKITDKVNTPCFIYDKAVLENNIQRIFNSASKHRLGEKIKIYLPYFANSNPTLFSLIQNERIGILLQTEEEWYQLQRAVLQREIIISPSFLSNEEIDFWVSRKIRVNLASLEEVEYVVKKYPDYPLCFRLDFTFWQNQRTSIKRKELPSLLKLLKNHNKNPHSFHIYTGTGSDLSKLKKSAKKVIKLFKSHFSNVEEINFGGGFDFDYTAQNSEEKHFDWDDYFSFISDLLIKNKIPDNVKFSFEPGRDVFADIGIMVTKVKRVIRNRSLLNISTDSSMVYMPSATKRARTHQLDFLIDEKIATNFKKTDAMLSGCTTLSSDYLLPNKVEVPLDVKSGDMIIIKDVGAYGATQHLEFLNKRPAPEILIKDNENYLITERGSYEDRVRYLVSPMKKI